MNPLLFGILLLAGAFLLLIVILLLYLREARAQNRVSAFSIDDPQQYARQATIANMASKRSNTLDWPLPRLKRSFQLIQSACAELNKDLLNKVDVPASSEWLLDNFYIIESQYHVLVSELRKREYMRLPVLQSGPYKGFARVFAMAVELIAGTNKSLDDAALIEFFSAYQAKNILLEREVRALPIVLRLVNLEDIRCLCEDIIIEVKSREKADAVYDEFLKDSTEKLIKFRVALLSNLKIGAGVDLTFAEHLCYRLRRSERDQTTAIQTVDAALMKFGTCVDELTALEHNRQSHAAVAMESSIKQLHYFSALDWAELLPAASRIEQILRASSDQVYLTMDLATRDTYKRQISLLAVKSHCSEVHTAREALRLADEAKQTGTDCGRTGHVGYYLVDAGTEQLISRLTGKPMKDARSDQKHTRWTVYLSTILLLTGAIVAAGVLYGVQSVTHKMVLYGLLCGLALLLPASEIAIFFINRFIDRMIKPKLLPKLELKDGIPEALSTMVIIPTLLSTTNAVSEILQSAEEHYLRNREKNLYFAVIGAFGDAEVQKLSGDDEILSAALKGIQTLNATYADDEEIFFFFHRERQYNESNHAWIGWERKRGAIMEFNDLVQGSPDTSFVCISSDAPPFSKIRYVITLDSETVLPIGMAKRLIGTISHPLNCPYVDPERQVVTRGYGLIQPHIDIETGDETLFSRIYTNQEGIDPYSGALSDVYQDMFDEGIFTGKGIYDLSTFQTVLKGTIPENAVLSHDLLEGSYLRTGLASDLTMIDGFPARYHSYAARQRRWIRGDWQLISYLCPRLRTGGMDTIKNPLSGLSRWKIFDNLRRSLVAPALVLLALLAAFALPGSRLVWLGVFLFTILLPFMGVILSSLVSLFKRIVRTKRYIPMVDSLKSAMLKGLFSIAFLPYEAWLSLSAILLTLTRLWITKRNLLEWVTSADSEAKSISSFGDYLVWMQAALWQALLLLAVLLFNPGDVWALVFVPIALMWLFSPLLAYAVSIGRRESTEADARTRQNLETTARKTWRYFEEFASKETHYLAPDNYQIEPYRGIAKRTSPTNIGFGLLAILSARDMGFIGTLEMLGRLENVITTIEGLPKWNGHLYNWYDTETLKPLHPAYISTVDSGNLTGYLMTLMQGMQEYLSRPLFDIRGLDGLLATASCTMARGLQPYLDKIREARAYLSLVGVGSPRGLRALFAVLQELQGHLLMVATDADIWLEKLKKQNQAQIDALLGCFSRLLLESDLPNAADAPRTLGALITLLGGNCAFEELPARQKAASELAAHMLEKGGQTALQFGEEIIPWLVQIQADTLRCSERLMPKLVRYQVLMNRIHALICDVRFLPLYHEKKKLFSIGYHIEEGKLTDSYYDLLASEARLSSYIAISNGEIPSAHWFSMGRALTVVGKYKGLVSWTGTMFEYLMPLLVMRSYQNTLLDETYSFAVKSQIRFGKTRNMPWGMSESAFNALDKRNDYQYKAIGVPWLGLKRGLNEDSVVAPYATFLALLVLPAEAIRNLAHLKQEQIDGPYGYYEAADYTKERLYFETKRVVIKSYMAHHQGMSLLAINNFLNHNCMQERFLRNPAIHAYRHLLQEKVPAHILLTKSVKEKAVPLPLKPSKLELPVRLSGYPNEVLPRVHILTNGNYSVMLTDAGTGYSKNKIASMTRWREDSTLDPYGTFFYLRDVGEGGAVWSAAYAPLNHLPERYEVEFTDDKAIYRRTDGDIDTRTEVFVATDDNAEIRKITLKNHSDTVRTIEITSYCEVVLAPRAADLAHMAFSNLFIETDFSSEARMVTAKRRPRSKLEKELWLGTFLVQGPDQSETIEFETDRMQFLGRTNDACCPRVLRRNQPLSRTVGAVLDPIISLRTRVMVQPGKSASVSFVTISGESREDLLKVARRYDTPRDIELSALRAYERSRIETKYRDYRASEIVLYLDMLSHLLFLSPSRRASSARIEPNHRGQSALWRYGISGDQPIVLLELTQESQSPLLHEVIKAYEYWGVMDISANLIVVVNEEYAYASPLRDLAMGIIGSYKRYSSELYPDEVVVLNRNDLTNDDLALLVAAARIYLVGGSGNMEAQLAGLARRRLPAKNIITGLSIAYPQPEPQERVLLYDNGIGGFSEDGSEYRLHLRHESTPAPWINVIANPNFGFIVSESGSGYTWFGNSHEFRLTPWSNDAVCDPPGEVIYLSDKDTGRVFTPTALPIRDEGTYDVRHGFGYTVFEHDCYGIAQSLTQFVPVDDAVKISLLTLRNNTESTRRLAVTYYMRPVLGVSDQTTAQHIRTSQSVSGTLLMENPYNEDFPGKICYLDCSIKERTVTGDRKEFFGRGGLAAPECLARQCLSGMLGIGFDPCGAMRVEITLQPGEEQTIEFLLGLAASAEEVEQVLARYTGEGLAQAALRDVIAFWQTTLGDVRIDTPNTAMNILQNGWLLYQVISCRLWARTGFYQSGGAYGFRDQLQDVLALAASNPALTRRQILLHASHQFTQGDVQHWWHAPLGGGIRTRFSDDFLWLPYVTAEYIRISGDEAILLEQVTFLESAQLSELEQERYERPAISHEQATLYEHCLRAIRRALRFGVHGLPLMGGGDWNDGMNTVGEKGLGESVWLGWFLASVLAQFSPICLAQGDFKTAQEFVDTRATLLANIEEHAWDGGWYRRAYSDDGSMLGSVHNMDCQIDSIAQSWAVLSGGNPERAQTAMHALEDYLVSRDEGLIKLLTPPFDKGESEPGYIKGYVPGVRENGGQYTHAAAWAIIATARLGEGDKAAEFYDLINPIHHSSSYRSFAKYKTEPYALAADVYAVWPHVGRGGWSWYTGAAGWLYRAGIESILGIRKAGELLLIEPCIPSHWQAYSVEYRYQGTVYHIAIRNPKRVQSGVVRTALDGAELLGGIPLQSNAGEHWVDVELG